MIGFDTDAIIEFFKKNPELVKVIESLDEDFCSSIINYQEIMFGFNPENSKHLEEKAFFEEFFNSIVFFDLDKNSCQKSNEIFWNFKSKGAMPGKFDCMIAGIFLSNGINKIITRNVKHYENISGLKVISY